MFAMPHHILKHLKPGIYPSRSVLQSSPNRRLLMDVSRIKRLRTMLEQVDPSLRFEGLRETLESRTAAPKEPTLDVRRVSSARMEAEIALESLDVLRRGGEVDADQRFVLEAIVMPYHRPVVDVAHDQMKVDQLTQKWQ